MKVNKYSYQTELEKMNLKIDVLLQKYDLGIEINECSEAEFWEQHNISEENFEAGMEWH